MCINDLLRHLHVFGAPTTQATHAFLLHLHPGRIVISSYDDGIKLLQHIPVGLYPCKIVGPERHGHSVDVPRFYGRQRINFALRNQQWAVGAYMINVEKERCCIRSLLVPHLGFAARLIHLVRRPVLNIGQHIIGVVIIEDAVAKLVLAHICIVYCGSAYAALRHVGIDVFLAVDWLLVGVAVLSFCTHALLTKQHLHSGGVKQHVCGV